MKSIRLFVVMTQVLMVFALLVTGVFFGVILWLDKTVDLDGHVRFDRYQILRPKSGGILAELYVLPGSEVKKGQPIFRVDNVELERQIADTGFELSQAKIFLEHTQDQVETLRQAVFPLERQEQSFQIQRRNLEGQRSALRVEGLELSLEGLKQRRERVSALFEAGLVSEVDLREAENSVAQADASLRQGKLEIEESQIIQDSSREALDLIRGRQDEQALGFFKEANEWAYTVSKLTARLERLERRRDALTSYAEMDGVLIGAPEDEWLDRQVEAGEAVMTVVDPKTILFVGQASDSVLIRIEAGLEAYVEIFGLEKRSFDVFQGHVERVDIQPEVGATPGRVSYPIRVGLEQPWVMWRGERFYLRDGMRGRVKIRAPEDSLLTGFFGI
ncbi:MAG: biotin/lipoyl-binding protein [Acidobacteriota bacterium]